jgi:malyl-CoA/(S)-citramalyl-CoA lyase
VFSPDDRLISRTRQIMAAMEEASKSGQGAVSLEGRLIDAASLRMAEHLLAKIELIEERQGAPARPAAGRSRSAA